MLTASNTSKTAKIIKGDITYSFFYNYLLYMSDSFLLIYLFVYSEHDIENILSCVMMKWLF